MNAIATMIAIAIKKYRTGGLVALATLLFVFVGGVHIAQASVPTISDSALWQNHPDDSGAIGWCAGYTPSGTTTQLYAEENTDSNGNKYWAYYNTDDFIFDFSSYCDAPFRSSNFQTVQGVPDSSNSNFRWMFIFSDINGGSLTTDYSGADTHHEPRDFNWKDATGDNAGECGSTLWSSVGGSPTTTAMSYGGVTYTIIQTNCQLDNTSNSVEGQGGWIEDIEFFHEDGTDGYRVYYMAYVPYQSTSDLANITNAGELQSFMSQLNGNQWESDGGTEIPPSTTNYIVITEPDDGERNISYSAFIDLQMNCTDCTSSTTSYKLEFFNQVNNYDYSSLTQCYTTTDDALYQVTVPVTFHQDDIIYARAHYYDNATCDRGTNGEDYIDGFGDISFWVSANGNPTGTVDLGVFRTTSTSTCAGVTGFSATSTSWYEPVAFANAGCEVARFLFVPNESSLQYIGDLTATATATAPFSYVYDVNQYMDSLFSATSTAWSIAMPSSTPVFGNVTLLSSTQIDNDSNYQLVKGFFTVVMYIALIMYVFLRVKRIGASL